MTDGKDSKSSKVQKPAGTQGDIRVGGSVIGSDIIIGHGNVINKYYQIIEKNTQQNDPDYWNLKHPYPMPPNFTGRVAERAMLTQWLNDDSENRLFILRALGGFGKSALTWHWLTHDVDIKEWPQVVFWSFYEGDASFERFIEETLKSLKLDVPQGQRPQVDELLKAMQSQRTLLIMDGFERALRAYSSMNAAYQGDEEPKQEDNYLDCVNINAEIFLKSVCSLPNIKSKVLMTTRLTPRTIKPRGEFMLGCREEELTAMQKADAVEFFHKQKIKGTHAEIEAACAPYGYHPLSLRLLAGRILKDFDNPADINVAQKLKIDGDIKQQKHHVLEVSYNSLSIDEQKLLNTIACFRSTVELKTLEIINKAEKVTNHLALQDLLHDLIERGLLHFEVRNKKFDLHPLVRRYSYHKLAIPDRISLHKRLQEFYLSNTSAPSKSQTFDDLASVIELYYHTAKIEEADKAWVIYRKYLFRLRYQMGRYDIVIELLTMLFNDDTEQSFRPKNKDFHSWTLNEISNSYCLSGQPKRAISTFEKMYHVDISANNKGGIATCLSNMAGLVQIPLGTLKAAEENLNRAIKLDKELKKMYQEADDRMGMGRLMAKRSAWFDSEKELSKAFKIAKKISNLQVQTVIWAYHAMRFLDMLRDDTQPREKHLRLAIEYAKRSLEFAERTTTARHSYPADYIRAYWLLGAGYRINAELIIAEENLSKALSMCRQINLVEMEADILLDLARLRYNQKNYEEAKSLAEEALSITERCGYVLQGADVNLFLAQYALEQEQDKAKAKEYAESALKLAHCDDGPPYYYKVAYEEAERMLEKL